METSSKQSAGVPQRKEWRNPRLAELEDQIAAQRAARMVPKAPPKPKRKRRKPAVPSAIRKEIARCARELNREHRAAFIADPKLKDRVTRMLRSMLPPKRKRGPSAFPSE